jgi:membrane protein DedA with SNARE-associated domain
MHRTIEFLLQHGYSVLLAWVFAEQVGLPLPSMPLLLAAGALAGTGRLSIWGSVFCVTVAAVAADSIWYQLGRRKGIQILQLLCRISLEPDSCVRRTEGIFSRQGARSLLLAKFVPGLSTVAPPLAGIFHMRPRRFLLFDVLGTLLWGGTFLGVGYLFSAQIEHVAQRLAALGGWLVLVLGGALAAYILYKYVARRHFLRQLRVARITADELKEKMDTGEHLVIVDLRHPYDFEAAPETIPGAVRMDSGELEGKADQLPRDREVILYCT